MWQQLPEPEWVSTPERTLQVCREIRDWRQCAIDTETTGLDRQKDFVKFWSLCPHPGVRYCLPASMLPVFSAELVANPYITWILTNATFDTAMLENSGVPLFAGPIRCTIVMDWMFDENRVGRHGLKQSAKDHLQLTMKEFTEVFPKDRGESISDAMDRLMEMDPAAGIDYASMDAWASLGVHNFLEAELSRQYTYYGASLLDVFREIEVPYTKLLHIMQRRGVPASEQYLLTLKEPLERDVALARREFTRIVGREVNLNSPKQLQKVFLDDLGLPPLKWTKGGASGKRQPSVDEDVLVRYAADGVEAAIVLMKHRKLDKMLGTYVIGLLSRLGADSRIYTSILQHGTRTGRISSREPNLTNLPRPDSDEYALRGAIVAPNGRRLKAADYGQMEQRVLADLSGDENMCSVISRGWDIHMGTASVMYDVPYEELVAAKKQAGKMEHDKIPKDRWPQRVTYLMLLRQIAKAIGFGQHTGRRETCSKRGNLSATA